MTNAPGGDRAPSSPPNSSSFFESLLYSHRGIGKSVGTHSLARCSQELGAQLCGRLSQIALEVSYAAFSSAATAAVDVGAATRTAGSPLASLSSAAATAPLSFMADVHRDLSAHYGSHAVRRGLSKPLGPCVHPVIHKGRLATQRAGVHSPRYMRVWVLRKVRRCWCPRCGVWLSRGDTHTLAKFKSCRATLATMKECRARCKRLPSRRSTTRGRFMLCCLRCLDTAQRAAKRNASLLGIAAGRRQQQQHHRVRSSAEKASLPTKHAVQKARAANLERTLKGVLAEARVSRRNRRCRRRSQCRCRGDQQEARTGAKVTARACSRNPTAVLHRKTSASQVTQKLTIALMRKTTPPTPVDGTGKLTKALIVEVPQTAQTAQRSLQSLVPSGPLRRTARRVSATRPAPRSSEKSPVPAPAACRNLTAVRESPATTSSVLQSPLPLPSPSISVARVPAQIADRIVDAGQEKDTKAFSKAVDIGTKKPPPTASVSHPTSPSTKGLPWSATPGPPVPSMPGKAIASRPRPTNAPKKAASPPPKTATATKKLIDTMNQLGF